MDPMNKVTDVLRGGGGGGGGGGGEQGVSLTGGELYNNRKENRIQILYVLSKEYNIIISLKEQTKKETASVLYTGTYSNKADRIIACRGNQYRKMNTRKLQHPITNNIKLFYFLE
jgi:hypothetical protein